MKFLMAKGRYVKLGRFDAEFLTQLIELLPKDVRYEYRERFLKEFERYSDKGKKRGEPKNEGCVRELEDIGEMDIFNPEIMARWLKEHLHTKYLKDNTKRERKSFFENF